MAQYYSRISGLFNEIRGKHWNMKKIYYFWKDKELELKCSSNKEWLKMSYSTISLALKMLFYKNTEIGMCL